MGWSWGAFLAGWVWAARHRVWIGLLDFPFTLYPPIWIGFRILMGVKGNQWAWQNRSLANVALFVRSQRAWVLWGAFVLIAEFALLIALFGLLSPTGLGQCLDRYQTIGGG